MNDETYRRRQVLRPTAGRVGCTRDHCTVEERAVIEASAVYREAAANLARYRLRNDEESKELAVIVDAYTAAETVWGNAVDQLLATKPKSEVRE